MAATGTNAAKTSADAAKSAAETAQKALDEAKASGIEGHQLFKSASEAAEAQNRAALEATRNDQRALVGVFGTVLPEQDSKGPYVRVGAEVAFCVAIKNFGRSIAREVESQIRQDVKLATRKFEPIYSGKPSTLGALYPGMEMSLCDSLDAKIRVTEDDVLGLTTGTYVQYVYGKITYKDIFGRSHRTTYCMHLIRSLRQFDTCDTYNEAD